jgi:hypothetical protein
MNSLYARIAECDRLSLGQRAEGHGLRAAMKFDQPFPYSSDPYQQQRFEQGFRDGKSLMEVDRHAHAIADRGEGTAVADGRLRADEFLDPVLRQEAEGQPSPYSA